MMTAGVHTVPHNTPNTNIQGQPYPHSDTFTLQQSIQLDFFFFFSAAWITVITYRPYFSISLRVWHSICHAKIRDQQSHSIAQILHMWCPKSKMQPPPTTILSPPQHKTTLCPPWSWRSPRGVSPDPVETAKIQKIQQWRQLLRWICTHPQLFLIFPHSAIAGWGQVAQGRRLKAVSHSEQISHVGSKYTELYIVFLPYTELLQIKHTRKQKLPEGLSWRVEVVGAAQGDARLREGGEDWGG